MLACQPRLETKHPLVQEDNPGGGVLAATAAVLEDGLSAR
jgi:hypothetical protein